MYKMITKEFLRVYATPKERELRQNELLKYLPEKEESQYQVYLRLSEYTLSFKTFQRDINELVRRELITARVVQNKGKRKLIRKC